MRVCVGCVSAAVPKAITRKLILLLGLIIICSLTLKGFGEREKGKKKKKKESDRIKKKRKREYSKSAFEQVARIECSVGFSQNMCVLWLCVFFCQWKS